MKQARVVAVCTVGLVLALLLVKTLDRDQITALPSTLGVDPLFDRSSFIAKVREVFKPIEAVLPKGDTLDYDRTVLFSGLPNNTNEHIVIVPVSDSSVSVQKAQRLGKDLTWKDANPIAVAAYYIIPPNEFSSLEAGKPYLTLAISWDKRVVVDQTGAMVKEAHIEWLRGCEDGREYDPVFGWMAKDWFLFLGDNGKWHVKATCLILSEDQLK